MKKIFNFVILGIIIAIIAISAYIFTQNKVGIPNSMIQTAVKARFPIEKSYPLGKIKLYNPKSYFENNKLVIEAEYMNDALNDRISGTMTFETDLRYEPMDSKLYLSNFTLKKLTKEGKDINIDKKPIIRTALNFAFSQLEKDVLLDLKSIEKFQTIRDIKIENNQKIENDKAKIEKLVKGYFLVIAATDNEELNENIANVCDSNGMLINNVSSKVKMNAMFGGIVKNSEFQIAISTSGKNCKRSRAMKSEIQKVLDKIEK